MKAQPVRVMITQTTIPKLVSPALVSAPDNLTPDGIQGKGVSRRFALLRLAAVAAAAAACSSAESKAAPTGTRPTVLSNVSVTSVSSTAMRVSGRLTTLDGAGVGGMRVEVYSVGVAYFTRWYVMYTDGSGGFSATMSKPPVNTMIQLEIAGNGAYNRPLPTFNRP